MRLERKDMTALIKREWVGGSDTERYKRRGLFGFVQLGFYIF